MSSMGGNKIYRINSLCVPEGVPCGLCVRTTDNTHSLTLFDEKANTDDPNESEYFVLSFLLPNATPGRNTANGS